MKVTKHHMCVWIDVGAILDGSTASNTTLHCSFAPQEVPSKLDNFQKLGQHKEQ
jgi:hypothetical protein